MFAPAAVLFLAAYGCGAGPPAPQPAATPRAEVPPPNPQTGFTNIVSGSSDSVGATSGSAAAPYRYRFRQLDPPSDRFTYQDRELSFYFKPSPDALHFQIENRQDRPVWIEWDRSTFIGSWGNFGKIANSTSTWANRYSSQAPTQIMGLQRYGDYLLPMEYLLDPAGSGSQLHRPLLPQDGTSPQYSGRTFGVDLVLRVEGNLRTYSFRFRVESVTPN